MYPNVPGVPEGWDLLRIGIPKNEYIIIDGKPFFFDGEWDLTIPAVIIQNRHWVPFNNTHHKNLPCLARARQNKQDPWVEIILVDRDPGSFAKHIDSNGIHYKYAEVPKEC